MLNIGAPHAAMRWWKLPCKGVGLARMEYSDQQRDQDPSPGPDPFR
jgi:hypothetical protein